MLGRLLNVRPHSAARVIIIIPSRMLASPTAKVCVLCPLARQPTQTKWHSLNSELINAANIDRKWRGFQICSSHFWELHNSITANSKQLSEGIDETIAENAPASEISSAQTSPDTRLLKKKRLEDDINTEALRQAYSVGREMTGLQSGVLSGIPPIGVIESCFPERNGTPRQGMLAPSSVARLTITAQPNPQDMVAGLEGFSHVWLLFVFHFNENMIVRSKVRPPRLGGVAAGVLATRTPHRPVPIGLSVARLERVEGSTLHLSGVDLLHGTPVLDVKPYVPYCDSVPTAVAPDWVQVQTNNPLKVTFEETADADLQRFESELKFFRSWKDIRVAIEQVCVHNINGSKSLTIRM